jgi:hypothetical protein
VLVMFYECIMFPKRIKLKCCALAFQSLPDLFAVEQ